MFFIFRFENPATKMGILWELAEADLDPSAKASADVLNFALRWLATKEWGCSY